jgi:hypothetical protein
VSQQIRGTILRTKAMRQGDMILAEAKAAIDAGFGNPGYGKGRQLAC